MKKGLLQLLAVLAFLLCFGVACSDDSAPVHEAEAPKEEAHQETTNNLEAPQEEFDEISEEDLMFPENVPEWDVEEAEIRVRMRVRESLEDFLLEHDWSSDPLHMKANGEVFFVVHGSASFVFLDGESSEFLYSCLHAYEKAVADAKSYITLMLEEVLYKSIFLNMGEPPEDFGDGMIENLAAEFLDFPDYSKEGRIFKRYCDRITALLVKHGFDADKLAEKDPVELAKVREELPALSMTKEFVVARSIAAFSLVQGLQAFYTTVDVEYMLGECGVIVVWNPGHTIEPRRALHDALRAVVHTAGFPESTLDLPLQSSSQPSRPTFEKTFDLTFESTPSSNPTKEN